MPKTRRGFLQATAGLAAGLVGAGTAPAQSPATAPAPALDVVGREIAPWQAGTLEIHQISSGRGNAGLSYPPTAPRCSLDAGQNTRESDWNTPDRPDGTRPAGERFVRYIRHATRHNPQPSIDYVLLTHFHSDHMGQVPNDSPKSRSGAYRLSGLTYVGEDLRIGKLLDRGWPDYKYPAPIESETMKNYLAFVKFHSEKEGMKVERFTAGRNGQVVLVREPQKYPEFEFRNIGVNGEVWTGVGSVTRQQFPDLETVSRADWPSENMCSSSFRLSYGKFDYFNGADIPGVPSPGSPPWHDVETPVAKAVGPVEAAILNHHGYVDTMNEFFVATLRPRVWTISVWDSPHPTIGAWNRIQSTRLYPGPRDVFATDLHPANRISIPGIAQIADRTGHVVLKVSPGGGEFRVVIVDNVSESHRVNHVFGPFQSR